MKDVLIVLAVAIIFQSGFCSVESSFKRRLDSEKSNTLACEEELRSAFRQQDALYDQIEECRNLLKVYMDMFDRPETDDEDDPHYMGPNNDMR